MRHGLIALLAAVALLGPGSTEAASAAQDSRQEVDSRLKVPSAGEVQELRLTDGTRVQGRIESIASGLIVFRTSAGDMLTVPRETIAAVVGVTDRPYATRLLFGPTARMLPRGKVAITFQQVAVPHVQVGATERFSMGGGFLPSMGTPIWLTPKVQLVATERLQAAAGLIQIFAAGETGGLAYGVLTYGSLRDAVTIGLEWAYPEWPGTGKGTPVVMIGAEHLVLVPK